MNEQNKFEILVMTLAEMSYHGDYDEEITAFEQKISTMGCKEPCFGTARSDWERIDIVQNKYILKRMGLKFYAEYYDGNQAPFSVCEWNDDFEKLERLLKETSATLYNVYQGNLIEK